MPFLLTLLSHTCLPTYYFPNLNLSPVFLTTRFTHRLLLSIVRYAYPPHHLPFSLSTYFSPQLFHSLFTRTALVFLTRLSLPPSSASISAQLPSLAPHSIPSLSYFLHLANTPFTNFSEYLNISLPHCFFYLSPRQPTYIPGTFFSFLFILFFPSLPLPSCQSTLFLTSCLSPSLSLSCHSSSLSTCLILLRFFSPQSAPSHPSCGCLPTQVSNFL